jgi:antitoxin component YwqK of YwqJK toxin-antitoxin module
MLKELDEVVEEYLKGYKIEILRNGDIRRNVTYGGINHGECVITRNGISIYRCTFKNGRINGIVEKWHNNGNLKFRCNYKNGRANGLYQNFDEYGVIEYQCQFVNGNRHSEYYHPNPVPI